MARLLVRGEGRTCAVHRVFQCSAVTRGQLQRIGQLRDGVAVGKAAAATR